MTVATVFVKPKVPVEVIVKGCTLPSFNFDLATSDQ